MTDDRTLAMSGHDNPDGETSEPRAKRDDSGEAVFHPPPTAPYAIAKQLYQGCRDGDGIRNLLAYRGGWQLWRTTHWSEIDAAEVRARIYGALEHAVYLHMTKDGPETRPWDPTKHKIANVMEAMAALGHLSSETDAPAWIDTHSVKVPAPRVSGAGPAG